MNYLDLNIAIQNSSLNNYYIFTGKKEKDEILFNNGLASIYTNKIAQLLQLQIKYIDDLNSIQQKTLFKINNKFLYIYHSDSLTDEIKEFLDKNQNIYIIIYILDIDKRTKLYKYFKNNIIDFVPSNTFAIEYIKNNCKKSLTDYEIEDFANRCNYDIGIINNELIKFNLIDYTYTEYKQFIYDCDKDAIFDLVKYICKRDKEFLYYLEHCKKINENPLAIIQVLSTNLKQILQVQNCTATNISEHTGLSLYLTQLMLEYKDNYTEQELINLIKLCFELDTAIKIGKIEANDALDYLMLYCLNLCEE